MTSNPKAIAKPTLYSGVQFRSRLEAKWAAFFDQAGWKWAYEPFELKGWTPDFVLHGANNNVIVEVKPIEWSGMEPEQVLQAHELGKVLQHRTGEWSEDFDKDELLVLGDGPHKLGYGWALGVFVEEHFNTAPDWAMIYAGHGDPGPLIDFAAEKGAYAYRMSGAWDGDHHIKSAPETLIDLMWKQSANMTQWRAPEEGLRPVGPMLANLIDKLREGDEP